MLHLPSTSRHVSTRVHCLSGLISMLIRCVDFNVGPLCWFQCWSAVTVNETSETSHYFELKTIYITGEWSLCV